MRKRFLLALPAVAALAVGVALAQDEGGETGFVRLLEGMLSTPDRRVAIVGLDGAFSSQPTVDRITVSDGEGPWLQIEGAELVWTRSMLFRRMLDINSLSAERITMFRRPGGGEASGTAAGSGMPIALRIDSFALPLVLLEEEVAGVAAELAVGGSAELTADAISAKISVDRQDRAGSLAADLRLEPAVNALDADLTLEESAGGLLAELLQLRGRPAIAINLAGAGPLDAWRSELSMQADGSEVLVGAVGVSRVVDGHRISADLAAALESIAPMDFAPLVAGESRLGVDVVRHADGAVAIESATLRSSGVEFSASGMLAADFMPVTADLSLKLGQAGRTRLPFAPGELSVASLDVVAGLEGGADAPWRVELEAKQVEGDFGAVAVLSVQADGEASNFADPGSRRTSFRLDGAADGIALSDAALTDAVGTAATLRGVGAWQSGSPVAVESFEAALSGAAASFSGNATATELTGKFAASVFDLRRFAGVAGRPLSGTAEVNAEGRVSTSGNVDLAITGSTGDLDLGVAPLDPLLRGATRIAGRVSRSGEGFAFENLSLDNDRADLAVSGTLGDALDLSVTAGVADLSLATPRAAGSVQVSASVSGPRAAPNVELEATGDNVVLMGRPLDDASARFSGVIAGPDTAGEAEISGTLAGAPMRGAARLSAGENGARRLEELLFGIGDSRVSGDLTIAADGLLSGALEVVSTDLSQVAPLLLVEANGMLRADVTLSAADGAQAAFFSGSATDIVYETVTLGSADIEGSANDLFGAPEIAGDFSVRDLVAGGLHVVDATGRATRAGAATEVSLDARLADGRTRLRGRIEPSGNALAVALEEFAFSRAGVDLALARPTVVSVANGSARFEPTTLNAGGGSVTFSGAAGAALDLSAELFSLPAALANSFSPGLGAEGAISGAVTVTGTPSAPVARFDLALANASLAASRNAGLGALSVTSQGNFSNGVVSVASRISDAAGLNVDVRGTAGVRPGAPLDLRVTGAAPLALGNRRLASRGAALEGALDIDVAVRGTASSPQFSGSVRSQGGGFVDPETGIVLRNLALSATLSGERVTIEQLTAESGDGTIVASGSIRLSPAAGFPVDLRVQVRRARYVDGTLIAATFDADLTMSGTMNAGPVLSGTVFLDRTELTVPEGLPRDSIAVDVRHVDPSPAVEETLAAARRPEFGSSSGGPRGGVSLDVTISAPRRIFVRGRGLDAELGGNLRVTGPLSSVSTVGAFQMVRGRLDILTRRIAFNRGIITFAGDLDPMLDFIGTTQSGEVAVTVTVSGRASDPDVTFSSIPELPQDEVLARLIFQRGIGALSPFQIGQLAVAAAQLAGGGGSGLLGQLRASTGLDNLDIVMDERGAPSLAAGRYISENVYLGVQQGTTTDSTRVTIDLDITNDVKARAGVSAQGDSSLGLFFEREY